MKIFEGEGFAEAYKKALNEVYHNPDYELSPRGMKCKELSDSALVIKNPLLSLYNNKRRSSQLKYIAAEILWYASGSNTVEWISQYAKMWDSLKNEKGCVNSAYGNLIFKEQNNFGYCEYNWAFESLIKDRDTRQAIMHFNKPHHQYSNNKDFVCTLNAIFQIRNNKLNLTVDMRSNDIILGLATDVAFFTVLQQQMLYDLRLYGNKNNIEDLKLIQLGTYTHIDHSLHLYERHFDLVKEMLENNFENIEMPILDYPIVYIENSNVYSCSLVNAFINNLTKNIKFNTLQNDIIKSSIFYSKLKEWLCMI